MSTERRKKLPPTEPRRPRRRRWILLALAAVLVIVGVFVIRPFWRLSSQFDDLTFRQPSRLYGLASSPRGGAIRANG
jgi:nitrogen fixation-related uncharacterized protein